MFLGISVIKTPLCWLNINTLRLLLTMNINAIVFARYNSSRLPGKVLYKLGSKTILGYCIDKLKNIPNIGIVVATSREESDSPIIDWCITNNVDFFRGDLKNVASRTYNCLLQKPCDA